MSSSIREILSREGASYVSTTSGYSMWPMLRDRRDRVVICSALGVELKRHDLPLYLRPDGVYVLHRILACRDGHYVIRGDNTFQREVVPKEWVVGYVTEFYRGERQVLSNSGRYRLYVAAWRLIYPLRWCVHKVRAVLSALRRRLTGRKRGA